MNKFERESRYFVIKFSDVEKLQLGAREIVEANMESADFYLSEHGAPNRQCLVIESDWPEYEVVWKMIEQRMTGTAPVVERQEPVAYRHTMHYGEGCGYRFELTDSAESPFGNPDVDYDKSFGVTCEPLFTSPPAPVSVVLPERKHPRPDGDNTLASTYNVNLGWNACLDKVKELNQ